jgi:hypothetical protein
MDEGDHAPARELSVALEWQRVEPGEGGFAAIVDAPDDAVVEQSRRDDDEALDRTHEWRTLTV